MWSIEPFSRYSFAYFCLRWAFGLFNFRVFNFHSFQNSELPVDLLSLGPCLCCIVTLIVDLFLVHFGLFRISEINKNKTRANISYFTVLINSNKFRNNEMWEVLQLCLFLRHMHHGLVFIGNVFTLPGTFKVQHLGYIKQLQPHNHLLPLQIIVNIFTSNKYHLSFDKTCFTVCCHYSYYTPADFPVRIPWDSFKT